MNLTAFRTRLEQTRLDPNMQRACLDIVDILSELNPDDGQHLGLQYFVGKMQGSEHPFLLPALSILCTMDAPILSMHGYLDADGDQHHLGDEEFRDLLQSGKLAHPVTGELVPSPLNHVRIFYAIRDDIQDES